MPDIRRYEDLPPKTREFIADLDDERIEEIEEAIKFMRATRTVSTFLRWCVITLVAAFLTTAALGEAIGKIWTWVTSAGAPR